jgi:4-hydroxybenzoyl-CoA reductase subunit beta
MMRLPRFHFVAPESLAEAVDVLASATPGDVMIVAGGTDLIPNMKRRQQTPGTLVGVRRISELQPITNGDGLTIGAGVTLTRLLHELRSKSLPALDGLRQAAAQVATPQLRNMGTVGGNLCLDTRCNY